ncbi:MAG: preprotein translocase subunit YajC [Chitinophagaceae bacterium]|jgi:preprotein translocase subunit YajC|nr:preprotein translocase subunit YajC [Chitinophagaceae bacterium]
MNHFSVLLQAAPNAGMMQLLLLGGMILVFYFFMIRPQAQKAKKAKTFQEGLQKGDKIVTIAGIHGVVNKVNEDNTIQVEISPGSYIKLEKSAISLEWSEAVNKATTTAVAK